MIYVSSKTDHAQMWKNLRAAGLPISSRWIDQPARNMRSDQYVKLWREILEDVQRSHVLIFYAAGPGEHMKGALVEIGLALAHGLTVLAVGYHVPSQGTWGDAPNVYTLASLDIAITRARKVLADRGVSNG